MYKSKAMSHFWKGSVALVGTYFPSKACWMTAPSCPPSRKSPLQMATASRISLTSLVTSLILWRERAASSQAPLANRTFDTHSDICSWSFSSSIYFCRSQKQFSISCSLWLAPSLAPTASFLTPTDPPISFLGRGHPTPFSLSSRKAMDLPRQSSALFQRISPALNSFTASWQLPSLVSITPLAQSHFQEQSSAALRLCSRQSLLSWSLPRSSSTRDLKQRARALVSSTASQLSMNSTTEDRNDSPSTLVGPKLRLLMGFADGWLPCETAVLTRRQTLQRMGSTGSLWWACWQSCMQALYLARASSSISLSAMRSPSQRSLLYWTSDSLPKTSLMKVSYSSQLSRQQNSLLQKNSPQALNLRISGYISSFSDAEYSHSTFSSKGPHSSFPLTCTRVELILGTARNTDLVEKYRSLPSFPFCPKPISIWLSLQRGFVWEASFLSFDLLLLCSWPFSSVQTSLRTLTPSSQWPLMMVMKDSTTLAHPLGAIPACLPSCTTCTASQNWLSARQSCSRCLQARVIIAGLPSSLRQYSRWRMACSFRLSCTSQDPKQQQQSQFFSGVDSRMRRASSHRSSWQRQAPILSLTSLTRESSAPWRSSKARMQDPSAFSGRF